MPCGVAQLWDRDRVAAAARAVDAVRAGGNGERHSFEGVHPRNVIVDAAFGAERAPLDHAFQLPVGRSTKENSDLGPDQRSEVIGLHAVLHGYQHQRRNRSAAIDVAHRERRRVEPTGDDVGQDKPICDHRGLRGEPVEEPLMAFREADQLGKSPRRRSPRIRETPFATRAGHQKAPTWVRSVKVFAVPVRLA